MNVLQATVEDLRYLHKQVGQLLTELEILVGSRPPHPQPDTETDT